VYETDFDAVLAGIAASADVTVNVLFVVPAPLGVVSILAAFATGPWQPVEPLASPAPGVGSLQL
jgi:hypothetical protein